MRDFLEVILLTGLAGATMPAGGVLARLERIQPLWLAREFRHSVVALGGGILLAAVALVLVPHGAKDPSLIMVICSMLAGGTAFCLLDIFLSRSNTPASQLVAMLSDFLPEAIALGATFAKSGSMGILLAVLIAMQNLPEGFNAYRELTHSEKISKNTILLVFVALVPLGPLAGLAGLYWLAKFPQAVDAMMLFAAGGILYLTFQDIAPQVKLEKHWVPPLGAVAGFLFGLVCQLLIES